MSLNTSNDLADIAARATFLSERLLGTGPPVEVRPTDPDVVKSRLERWRESAANGYEEKFRRRLQWGGIDPKELVDLVSDVKLQDASVLPEWAYKLSDIADGVVDDSLGGIPLDGSLDTDEPLPFERLLLGVVQGARAALMRATHVHSLTPGQYPLQHVSVSGYCDLERALLHRLVFASQKVFLAEFNSERPAGQTLLMSMGVTGNGGAEHFDRFVARYLASGLMPLFSKYPVLARELVMMVDFWVKTTKELFDRLAHDHDQICHLFQVLTPGLVTKIQSSLSDPHKGGRSVLSLEFESGFRLVYKPKCLSLERAYADLLSWCNASGLPLQLRTHRVLCGDDYGWVEFIEHLPCLDDAAVKRYYHRAGMMLCQLYALGATDCHHENLIASGEHPMLIDMETLLHPDGTPLLHGHSQHYSVLRTGLLPRWDCQQDTRNLVDVSGFGFVETQVSPVLRWQDVNTDDMRMDWVQVERDEHTNAPMLDGVTQMPGDHLDEMLNGFREMYSFLLEHREQLLAPQGPLAQLAEMDVRFIFRATRFYWNVLDRAMSPDRLRNGIDWGIDLENLSFAFVVSAEKPAPWPLLRAEQQALEQMDIPFFGQSAAAAPQVLGLEQPLDDYFRKSGYAQMLDFVGHLSEADCAVQLEIIRGTVVTRRAKPHSEGGVPVASVSMGTSSDSSVDERVLDCEALSAEAVRLGLELTERVVFDDERATWLGLTYILNTERFQVNLLSSNLYDGVPGVALFFAGLYHVGGGDENRRLAEHSLVRIRDTISDPDPGQLQRVIRKIGLGGALGYGSVLYALARTGTLLGDESMVADARAAALVIPRSAIQTDKQLDVMKGSAGALLGLLSVFGATHDAGVLALAHECGARLVSEQISGGRFDGAWSPVDDSEPLPGFSHGAAGISYALGRLHAVSPRAEYAVVAERGFAFERRLFTAEDTECPDFSRRPDRKAVGEYMVGWCHGAPGLALARLGVLNSLGEGNRPQEITNALKATADYGAHGLDHMCCGNFGRIEALLVGSEMLARPELRDAAIRRASRAVTQAHQTGNYRLRPHTVGETAFFNPPFFQGISGIGYQLLRLSHPGALPSVLLWD